MLRSLVGSEMCIRDSPLPVALQLYRGAYPSPRPARSALSQHAVTLPALRFASHSIAPQNSKRMPRYLSAFFLVLLASLEICPRAGILESYWNKDGIIHGILESRRNNQHPRQPILPFGRGPRTACTFAARAAPFFEGDARTAAAGPRGLILASAPGVSSRTTPFCPFLAKTGGSHGIL